LACNLKIKHALKNISNEQHFRWSCFICYIVVIINDSLCYTLIYIVYIIYIYIYHIILYFPYSYYCIAHRYNSGVTTKNYCNTYAGQLQDVVPGATLSLLKADYWGRVYSFRGSIKPISHHPGLLFTPIFNLSTNL